MTAAPRERAIGDYAIIGDCRSAALISRAGSIDWLCWPRFDSPSLFGALLDTEKGGCWSIAPAAPFRSERRYIGNSNVLETTFHTDSGVVRVVDLMPVDSEREKRRMLWPQHELTRVVHCTSGEVAIEVRYEPRPDYARTVPHLRDRGPLGIFYEHRGSALIMRSEIPVTVTDTGSNAVGRAKLRQGDCRYLSLVFGDGEAAVLPELGAAVERKVERSIAWWEDWAKQCTYDGPYRHAVVRSALTLKLLAYAPSGAVVAAPTTSLPERIGGVRNWDYRYCWLRDASLTLQALFDLGYSVEAESFLAWLLTATRMTWPELQVMYDVYGETRLAERELAYLDGFDGSRPVRVGNAARAQLQLDIYGELIDSVYQFVCRGGRLDRATGRLLIGLGETVCRRWREPDDGIWDSRGGRRHHTYSKAMCWVALDRLIKLHESGHLPETRHRFAHERTAIREEVERHGFNERLGSYVSVFGGDEVDASLLQLARHAFVEPCSPRMVGTVERIERELGVNGLLYRYRTETREDGLPPGEGTFGICSFWAVSVRALQHDTARAEQRFTDIMSFANDVGLFAEEIDPDTGGALGNFPQAFTHVGLIDAALALADAERSDGHRGGMARESAAGMRR
jgi:GH15 family glucan-1,4-alpha-glucosidase